MEDKIYVSVPPVWSKGEIERSAAIARKKIEIAEQKERSWLRNEYEKVELSVTPELEKEREKYNEQKK